MKIAAYLPAAHQPHCAVNDPTPCSCDCGARRTPLVTLADAEAALAAHPAPSSDAAVSEQAFEEYFCTTLADDGSEPQSLIDACRTAAFDAWREVTRRVLAVHPANGAQAGKSTYDHRTNPHPQAGAGPTERMLNDAPLPTYPFGGAQAGPLAVAVAADAEIAELRAALAATQADLEEWRFTNKVDDLERRLAAAQAPSAPVCPTCKGSGEQRGPRSFPCVTCDGTGEVLEAPSAPVARDLSAEFEAWAKNEGLIQESFGIRSEWSGSVVAKRAFDAGAALSVKADEPIAWIESEPSVRGCDPRSFIHGMCNTVMFHTKRPMTTNPVWPLYLAAPTPPATGEA